MNNYGKVKQGNLTEHLGIAYWSKKYGALTVKDSYSFNVI